MTTSTGYQAAYPLAPPSSAAPCARCGSPDACACSEVAAELRAEAGRLAALGYTLARERRYHVARTTLTRAAELLPLDAAGQVSLGLCCFALGDVQAAVGAWRRGAADGAKGARAAELLTALNSPAAQAALQGYADSLRAANAGDMARALAGARACREVLPDFLPAAQLALIAASGTPTLPEVARSVLARFPDDPTVARLASNVAAQEAPSSPEALTPLPQRAASQSRSRRPVALAFAAGLVLGAVALEAGTRLLPTGAVLSARPVADAEPPVPTAPDSPPVSPASSDGQIAGRVAALALSADVDSLSALRGLVTSATVPLDVVARAQLDARLEGVARTAYGRALRLLARRDYQAAAAHLRRAAEAPASAYFADDALYAFATALEGMGDRAGARAAAARLLAEHPTSPLANSRMRRLATSSSSDTP